MAYEVPDLPLSFEGGSTSLAQYRFVAVSSTRENSVVFPTTGGQIAGVMTNDYDSTEIGKGVSVQYGGIAKVEAAGSTVAFGDNVTPDSSGRAAAASTANEDRVAGVVVEGSSGSTGRIFSVLLTYGGRS